jgi:hypothetical protein
MTRNLILNISGLEIRDPMMIIAKIVKDSKSNQPDFAEITIFNLSEGTRAEIALPGKQIAIYGGHGSVQDLIFLGDVQSVTSAKDGTEWTTAITAGDGSTAMKQAIINKSYSQPVKFLDLVNDLVTSSGLAETVENIGAENFSIGSRGSAYAGSASKYLTDIAEAHGYEWNIQDGAAVVSKIGSSRAKLYKISVETGMIGSPEWVNTGKDNSHAAEKDGLKIKVKSLCIPSIKPIDQVNIISRTMEAKIGGNLFKTVKQSLNDFFVVSRIIHNLSSRQGEFSTEIEATTKP